LINIGLIGIGFVGEFHAENIRKNDNAKLSFVCDINKNLCKNFANKSSCDYSHNYIDLLDGGVDAVYVCTPNALHTEIVLEAIKRNIHVFSEKPMATNIKEAQEIYDAVKKNNSIKYQVGHNRRFAPVYKKVKELIDTQIIPYISHVKMMRGGLKSPSWVNDPKISGGFLYESTIHVLDLIDYFFSGIKSIRAYVKKQIYKNQIDEIVCLFKTKKDYLVTLTSVGHSTWMKPFERFEIIGAHCCIETQEMDKVIYSPSLDDLSMGDKTWDFNQLAIPRKWGYEEEDYLFIDSIINDKPTVINENIGLRSIEIVEALKKSAENNGDEIQL